MREKRVGLSAAGRAAVLSLLSAIIIGLLWLFSEDFREGGTLRLCLISGLIVAGVFMLVPLLYSVLRILLRGNGEDVEWDKNAQFTVYRPEAVPPSKWCRLLVVAHLSSPAEDTNPHAEHPAAEVNALAERILGDDLENYQPLTQDARAAVPRAGEITLVPQVPGIEFNPPSRSFYWTENLPHCEQFDLRASPEAEGQEARGRLSVFLGAFLLAEVTLAIRVDREARIPSRPARYSPVRFRAYRKVFASYSHKDAWVVEECQRCAAGTALGDQYVRDCMDLRGGEVWNERLKQLIDEADVFQLFWSSTSMHSSFVREEWEHALSLGRADFVRPTYWEEPLPADAAKGLPPKELACLQFQRISPQRRSRGDQVARFPTGSELLIVVVLLGILSAIVIPQFTQSSKEPRERAERALRDDLQTLRNAVQLYAAQHRGKTPCTDEQGLRDDAGFYSRLTGRTQPSGKLDPEGECGPYLLEFPSNPFLIWNRAQVKLGTADPPPGDGTTGWYYNINTGRLSPNDPQHANR